MADTTSQIVNNGQPIANLPQMMINNMAMTYISKLMDQTDINIFSFKTLIKIGLILSIDELRKGIKDIFLSGKEYAPDAIKYLWGKAFLISVLSQKIKFPFIRRIEPEPIVERILEVPGSKYSFEWKNCQVYSKLIYNQITNNPNCKSTKIYGRMVDSVEHGKNVDNIDYIDVEIPIGPDKILSIDKITFKSDTTF